ncbi:hypothetical protein K0M31_005049 [Melipona bicolor]|uniref:Uncharacterized protein n=1 Tax=Melipona bicolor TaxID=60889 RepID=A0AA40FVZ9_9HYME|nr:hypothetical protein K0M31_005049 [Melipona bicolor]
MYSGNLFVLIILAHEGEDGNPTVLSPEDYTGSKMRITIVASELRFYQFSEINHRRGSTDGEDYEDVSS